MLRRFFSCALIAITSVVGLCALTAPASADVGTCYWSIYHIPTYYRIGVDQPYVTVGGSCTYANNYYLTANIHRATGAREYIHGSTLDYQGCSYDWIDDINPPYDCISFDTFDEYSPVHGHRLNITTVGTLTTHYSVGLAEDFPGDYTSVYTDSYTPQVFYAKLATRTSMTVTRVGSKNTWIIHPTHYNVAVGGFVRTGSEPIYIQRYVNGAWTDYKTVSSSTGTIVYSAYTSVRSQWRAHTPVTNTTWGSLSQVVTR